MADRSRAIERPNQPGGRDNLAACVDAGLPSTLDETQARRIAQSQCTILISGETGVGKGRVARWLHEHSPRAAAPFIPINCGAIPDSMIDSQLFGHARGAFTGAVSDHIGLVRAAQRGALLLDEVGELPASAQVRLLRLLQDREVQPVGQCRPTLVDVRVIAATSLDLHEAAEQRRFRSDLLFRLEVVHLVIPPLSRRRNELPGLLRSFNAEFARLYGQDELEFDEPAMELLQTYGWPGNVRQLRALLERLHVLCPGERITAGHVVEFGQLHPPPRSSGAGSESVSRLKVEHVRRVLREAEGSIRRTAEIFGVHRSTIYRWLREA
jgi:two-component system, NtrC family, response regulator HydG